MTALPMGTDMSTPAPASQPPPYRQPQPPPSYAAQAAPSGEPPAGYAPMPGVAPSGSAAPYSGELGRMRPTGMTMLLFFVTLGIWAFVYYFQVFEEMRRHTGRGLGGPLALIVSVIFGVVTPFLLSNEVGQLYELRGRPKPVTAATGLWFFPGILILVGPFIWFVRTNNALNEYWRGLGVRETTLV
jgi:Domain of unknown function (DUF4234)